MDENRIENGNDTAEDEAALSEIMDAISDIPDPEDNPSEIKDPVSGPGPDTEGEPAMAEEPLPEAADETSAGPGDDVLFEEENVLGESEGAPDDEKKKRKVPLAVIIAAACVCAVIIAYLIICGCVKSTDTILNNVYVDGVDVGGLTVSEASSLLSSELSGNTSDAFIEISALGETYSVSLGDVLDTDWDKSAQACYERGHGSFITCGWYWIVSLFSGTELSSAPYAAYEDQLYSALDEAGLTTATTMAESSWEVTDEALLITLGTTGQTPDIDSLCTLIFEAIEEGDLESIIECPLADDAPEDLDLDAIYEEIYTEPTNATLDPDNDYAIVESIDGVSFDTDSAQEAIDSAAEGETVSIELVYTEPDIDTADLEENLFADTLGTYTTSVSGTSARRSNVKLASESCEVILLPGETFSYNDTVGERTTARGYQAAPAYSNGETVQEVGGGICQVSSTLYVACLYANLEITERHAHSYASSYVPLGWDATVAWGGSDFKFTNNTNYPIKIEASYSSDNKLTMSIIGTDETGYTVKIVSETYSTTAYETETIEDDTLEEGKTVVEQTGYTGYKVQTWRYVYDSDGNLISDDEEAYSVYSKRNKIVRVGTKGSDDDEEEAEEDADEDDE